MTEVQASELKPPIPGGEEPEVTKRWWHALVRERRAWRPELGRGAGLGLSFPFIVLAVVLIVYPFIRLLTAAFGPPGGLSNLSTFLDNSGNLRTLRITFGVSAIVTLVSVAAGSIIAWSLKTTRSRLVRTVLLSSILVPFWMGSVIKLYAWTVLLQSRGVINRTLLALGVIDEPLNLLYNQLAVVLGMTHQMLPYAVLPLYVAFLTVDLDLVLAAESLGASRLRALRSVVLPLATPGVLATVTLVFVICLGFFLTPVVLGGFTAPFSASLIAQNIFVFYNLVGAAVTAVFLLAGAGVAIWVGIKVVGKERLRRALG